MSDQPPEVKVVNGQLFGWADFELWAWRNSVMWRQVIERTTHARVTHADGIRLVAYLQTQEIQRLHKTVEELRQIAPKKIRTKDGFLIWHCPDDLVPEEKQ